jgi:hypothetical protein
MPIYLFSNSQADTITPPPVVKCRNFSAMTAFSETVAEANFRLKIFTFFRRCRRRCNSFRRSLLLTNFSSLNMILRNRCFGNAPLYPSSGGRSTPEVLPGAASNPGKPVTRVGEGYSRNYEDSSLRREIVNQRSPYGGHRGIFQGLWHSLPEHVRVKKT